MFKNRQHEGSAAPSPGGTPPPSTSPAGADPVPGEPGAAGASPAAPPMGDDPHLVVPHTRTSAAYSGVAVGLLVLVVIVIFIAQNLGDASVHFFTLRFRMPIGLLALASVVAGGLLVLLVSAARLAQMRLMARRHRAGRPTA